MNTLRSRSLTGTLLALTLVSVVLAFSYALPIYAADPTPEWEVRDANGEKIGFMLAQNLILRKVSSSWVAIPYTAHDGFIQPQADTHAALYPTNDCSGTAYWPADQEPQNALVLDDTLYYGTGTTSVISMQSAMIPGESCGSAGGDYVVRVMATQLGSFSEFIPPFRVTRQ